MKTWTPTATARVLAAAVRRENPDLVLTGLQSDDLGFAQTGVILAEILTLPHSTIVMEIQAEGDALKVKRELEGGWFQWIEMPLPALLTIQSGINKPRYATLKGIMAAKNKPLQKLTAAGPRARRRSAQTAPGDFPGLRAGENGADRIHRGQPQGNRRAAGR